MKKKLLICLISSLFIFTQYIQSFAFTLDKNDKFKVKPLPYAYDALEPYIDKETMMLHHDKHYQNYVDKLNIAISKYPNLHNYTLNDLLKNIETLPSDIALTVKNNAGGAYNHGFFFDIMNDKSQYLKDELLIAIEKYFDSYDNFKSSFKKSSLDVFGSGWAWLVSDKDGNLSIITTANQDSPITLNLTPIIGIDIWEHAYYLKYQNRRTDYIDNCFNVINWDKALENYRSILN